MDAHRRDVFSALYRVTDAAPYEPERLDELDPATVLDPAATLSRWKTLGTLAAVAGEGAVAYQQLLAPPTRLVHPPALAGAIGRMAIARARHGLSQDPASVHALYVRRPDAEVERERKIRNQRDGAIEDSVIVQRPSSEG
jgi:hypothetical protein